MRQHKQFCAPADCGGNSRCGPCCIAAPITDQAWRMNSFTSTSQDEMDERWNAEEKRASTTETPNGWQLKEEHAAEWTHDINKVMPAWNPCWKYADLVNAIKHTKKYGTMRTQRRGRTRRNETTTEETPRRATALTNATTKHASPQTAMASTANDTNRTTTTALRTVTCTS